MVFNNYGDKGWYRPRAYAFTDELAKIWAWTMDTELRDRLAGQGWMAFLAGKDAGYPAKALREELELTRQRIARMRDDPTSPDTRLADWAMQFNPVSTRALVELLCGGHRTDQGLDRLFGLLHVRVRYFDPVRRRAGLPEDVAALITAMDAASVRVAIVNVNQVAPRTVIVQGGAYGEHQILDVAVQGKNQTVQGRRFVLRLAPGAGTELVIRDRRYANRPTMSMPWNTP